MLGLALIISAYLIYEGLKLVSKGCFAIALSYGNGLSKEQQNELTKDLEKLADA